MADELQNDGKVTRDMTEKGCLIVGDIILDRYISGEVSRISPEAPIPVLRVQKERTVLGGAANVAGNVRGYHVPTYLAGVVGQDAYGTDILRMLRERDIRYVGVVSEDRKTTIKSRVIAMSQQIVRVDQEDTCAVPEEESGRLLAGIAAVIDQIAVVVLSDYNKGICTENFCVGLLSMCHDHNVRVIVDPKSTDWTKYRGAALITPNFQEFKAALGRDIDNTESAIQEAASKLLHRYGLKKILVTRSQYGMTLTRIDDKPLTYQTVSQEVYDVSGAGDTVIGTVAALLSKGLSYERAIEVSNYAAGLAVSKAGTYTVTMEEVSDYMHQRGSGYQTKIIARDKITEVIGEWKKQGEKIVFTNGCFDILHAGHIAYLTMARMLGSKLIVGVNADASVRRLKGDGRPVNSQEARVELLAALQCVDAVTVFEEDTPEELVRAIMPDYLVKGGDYKIEEVAGRQYAAEVRIIPFREGFSTTGMIERIHQNQ